MSIPNLDQIEMRLSQLPSPTDQLSSDSYTSTTKSPLNHHLLPIESTLLQMNSYYTTLLFCFIYTSGVCLPHRSSANGDREIQKTLAMIKPDGVSGGYSSSIKKIIQDSGFVIVEELATELDEDAAKSFYAEHASKSFFQDLVQYMTSGPVLVMVLEKDNAIADWRALIGPTDAAKAKISHPHSIRAMCGKDGEKNCVHGSDSSQSATREISFFFNNSSPGLVAAHDEL